MCDFYNLKEHLEVIFGYYTMHDYKFNECSQLN